MLKNILNKKSLNYAIILLFVGASIVPGIVETVGIDPIDTTPPEIIINFAGNLSDSGGPFWRPPGESVRLMGMFSDGYYTNESRQQEDWIYINLTATDDTAVDEIWLHWLNGTTWTNNSYQFINSGGNYWEFNSSGNITTAEGYNYSFDVWANDTVGNSKTTWWNKTGIGEVNTRRYIQLNCTPINISYTAYYFYDANYLDTNPHSGGDIRDRLHHDQGQDGTIHDTGYLLDDLPDYSISSRYCDLFIGYWFDESVCVQHDTIDNIYLHFWWNVEVSSKVSIGYDKSRGELVGSTDQSYTAYFSKSVSNITMSLGTFYLETHLMTLTDPPSVGDNDIYEVNLGIIGGTHPNHDKKPHAVSHCFFPSFVIFNVPDNTTLQGQDTDDDNLTDYEELWVTYTSPFLGDTDNDGFSDYDENLSGTDPNNYTDPLNYICGDVNNDESINGADVVYLINYLSHGGPEPQPWLCVGDVDGDGDVDSDDVDYLIAYLYQSGPAPVDDCCV